MGAAGVLGVVAPRELGGEARDFISLGIAIEEIAAADMSCALIAWQQATFTRFFPGWGDETVRSVLRGETTLALATSEEDAGSDVSAMRAAATPDGDDYVVNGTKIHVSQVPGAEVLAVSARIHDGAGDGSAKRPMVLLRVPADAPGVSCAPMAQMGVRAHQLGVVRMNNVRVPRTATLGGEGQGKALMYARYNVSRCMSPLAALGAARAVLDETMAIARAKVVFGRPIAANQSISFPLVEHHTKIEAARLLVYRALAMNDAGLDATRDTAMGKWLGITTGVQAIQECLQLLGANGYLKDYGVEQRLRDVNALYFTGGTIQIMKSILVRELLGAEFAGLRA
jgi:cyclohexanecarboxyl-CoA dehydrogenase